MTLKLVIMNYCSSFSSTIPDFGISALELLGSTIEVLAETDTVDHIFSLGRVRLSPLGTSATVGLLYQPRMIDDDDYGAIGGWQGKPKYSEKTCPSATLSTTNPT
jgi:hypothetical protein